MTTTRGQNWQDVQQTALDVVGTPVRTSDEVITGKINQHLDSPLRMYASFPTADTLLNFASNKTVNGDGTSKSTPALDSTIQTFAAAALDLNDNSLTVGTFYRDGVAYTRPASTLGEFKRAVFVYRGDNVIDCAFSGSVAAYGLLADPGTLFDTLDGIPIGWIDLVGTATAGDGSGSFKTASSAGNSATDIIENAVGGASAIFRIAAGGGAGGGAIKDFKIQAVLDPNATIKGGYLKIDDNRELATYDGAGTASTDFGKDLVISLDTVFGSGPADATAYYLYVDLDTLGAQVTLSDNGRRVYGVVEANFKLSTTPPEEMSPRRYVPIGVIQSATTGNAWSGTGSKFATTAIRHHETLTRFFTYPEIYVDESIVTELASTTLNHNLSGEPHSLYLTYDDGTTEIGLDNSSHLLDVTASQIKISSLGLTFGSGQKLRVRAVRFPQQPALASSSRSFTSQWMTSNAVTTLPHGLNDFDDIKGYAVEEWDVTGDLYRLIDPADLIQNFDSTNLYLDWTALSPTPTLQYRVIVGGSPNPYSIPLEYGGITKFVGYGPGSYATLTAAKAAAAAGDVIMVMRSTVEPAGDFDWDVPDVRLLRKPGAVVGLSGALTNGFQITAARVLADLSISIAPTGAQARGISVEAADCVFNGRLELTTAQTVTDGLHGTAAALRLSAKVALVPTLGSFTNPSTNNGTAAQVNI